MLELFKKYDIELDREELDRFSHFLQIFKEKNKNINLSSIREDNDIILKHFIDSIMLNVFLELYGLVGDLGTGGGFPLIPLAITNPQVQFVGIDSVEKKLKAVDEFGEKLSLENIKTINSRAEDLGQNLEYREKFDFIVSRSTAYLPTLLEYAIPLLKVSSIFIAYKLNDKEELQSAKKALSRLGAKILKVKNYSIGEQERVLIFFEKTEKTNPKYPRKNGIPLAKPIK